jgi:Zn-dependent protease
MSEAIPTNCPHCGAPLPPGALVCPNCRQLVYRARLMQLLTEAQRLESVNPVLAAGTWRQAQALLPPDAPEYQQMGARAAALSAGMFAPSSAAGPVPLNYARPRDRNETWMSALLKTGGSMALSIYVYAQQGNWPFAIGFVLLILIHEMGHVVANWYYGIKQSPPIFIPYMGAVIFLRQNPPDAKAEAVVGIAGPVAGTAGALLCYLLGIRFNNPLLEFLAMYAFLMNLFNMVPCPPLDGGRVAAAISPVLWVPGVLLFLGALYLFGHQRIDFISIFLAFWILQSALPRVRAALTRGGQDTPYFQIGGRARLAVITSYLLLTALLVAMLFATPLAADVHRLFAR